ncbi:MAG: hypothetical protein U0Z70_20255 [Thermomicrobiales bacterium]
MLLLLSIRCDSLVLLAQPSENYSPTTVEQLLNEYPLPKKDDVFWLGSFERSEPVLREVEREVQILTYPGYITYYMYADADAAQASSLMQVGSVYPIDTFADTMASGDQFHNLLVRDRYSEIVGREIIFFGEGDSASACIQELNIVVCGFSSLSWSDTPSGAAISAAVVGLALLLDAAGSNVASSRQHPTSPTKVPTAPPLRSTPTPTPIPWTPSPPPTRTSFPTPEPGIEAWIPTNLQLDYGDRCRVESDGSRDFDEMMDRLGGRSVAEPRLMAWGWQGMRFRTWACNNPPRSGVALAEVNVHRFASAADAQEAVAFFADARAAGTRLIVSGGEPGLGDYSVVVTGPIEGGKEFTIYASRGSSLIKVTGVSTSGIPFIDVRRVALDVLSNQTP